MRVELLLIAFVFCAGPSAAADEALDLPVDLATYGDGRAAIQQLYSTYARLLEKGWALDVIAYSEPEPATQVLPIIALRSPHPGPALWIISGIHGEEPAGPNAIARVIDDIARFGESSPAVLIPIANPHGYVRNWRYLNVPLWSDDIESQSVGDSSHMLPGPGNAGPARATAPSSPEAAAVTRYIVETIAEYPPAISIDLHEDDKISAGYVYSQGVRGADEPLAIEAVRVLGEKAVPVKLDGETRFNEKIEKGIIGPVIDSSIDELMSATEIIVDNKPQPGPSAPIVLVFETPAAELPLQQRTKAHEALLRRMIQINLDRDH